MWWFCATIKKLEKYLLWRKSEKAILAKYEYSNCYFEDA